MTEAGYSIERGGVQFRVLDWSGVSVDGRPIDYPRAWEIARAASMDEHDPRCSYRQCDGGMLCDCPVLTAHPEYAEDAAARVSAAGQDDTHN